MRKTCRFCGNERKAGVDWYDDDYCSGKCKKLDGGVILPEIEKAKHEGMKATIEDYFLDYPVSIESGHKVKGRTPKRYRRRYQPERLNWSAELTAKQLKQAGLRANRESIPGDWDFVEEVGEDK